MSAYRPTREPGAEPRPYEPAETDYLGPFDAWGAAYTHTTIEHIPAEKINVWGAERDYRDAEDGREDVDPLDDPIANAIGEAFARSEEMVYHSIHLDGSYPPESRLAPEDRAFPELEQVSADVTVTVGDGGGGE